MKSQQQPEIIFANLKASNEPFIIQSMCVHCQANGKTTMLLTNIPFFREIVVVAFHCEECGNKNSQIQFGGQIADQGIKLTFTVSTEKDLNRELIKSQYATIFIPELEFEIPSNKKGDVTTIEGLINRCIDDLSKEQLLRKTFDENMFNKIDEFLRKLNQLKSYQGLPFTLIIDDPSGLSFIKNPFAPKIDAKLKKQIYNRSSEQVKAMGFSIETQIENIKSQQEKIISHKIDYTKPFDEEDLKKESLQFDVQCHSCGLMGETKMCQASIPYFSDLIIMSFICSYCGAHSTETKTSKSIGEFGTKITIKPDKIDLTRDLFKSDTCSVQIPQLELELDYGTLGGVYTTIQGLLEKVHDNLNDNNPFADSDSAFSARMKQLLNDITKCRNGQKQFTLVLTDPLAHTFVQNPNHPHPETKVIIQKYTRTQEQNDFLGISYMKVEDY